MSNSNIKAVTQQELTSTDIDYSIKIGKQVIKSKLSVEIDKLYKLINEQVNAVDIVLNGKEVDKALSRLLAEHLNADVQFSKMRLLINMFSDATITKNFDLIQENRSWDAARNLVVPGTCNKIFSSKNILNYKISSNFIKAVKSGQITIHYKTILHIPNEKTIRELKDPDGYHDEDIDRTENTEWDQIVKIPFYIMDDMKNMLATAEIIKTNSDKLTVLVNKLENIDLTMEEMEAQLLVKELSNSERGRDVLDITSSIVANIIGETPTLLQLHK